MADIVTRLLLDTKNFDANLERSKNSVNTYQSGIGNLAKTAGAGVLKFAGAIGVVTGAAEAFTKTMSSSQTAGDAWASVIGSAKASVNEFFYSLSTGDFSGFLDGLDAITSKARDSIAALDQLGNTRISHSYFSAENASNIAEAQYTAKNKFAPIDERVAAFGNWKTALEAQGDINKTLQHDLVAAITTSIETEIGAKKIGVSMDDVRMALKIDVTNPLKREELKKQYSADYDVYKNAASHSNDLYQSFDKKGDIVYGSDKRNKGVEYRVSTEAEREKAIGALNKKYREAIIVNAMLNKYSDEELTNIANMASEYQKLTASLHSVSREYNETANEFNNSNKAVNGFTPVQSLEGYKVYRGNKTGNEKLSPPSPAGSIAALNEQLAEKNKELINATTIQARADIQSTINELEGRKINLDISTKKEVFKLEHGENRIDATKAQRQMSEYVDIDKQIAIKSHELVNTTTEQAQIAVRKTIEELEAKKVSLKISIEKEVQTNTVDALSQKNFSEYVSISEEIEKQNTLLTASTTDQARTAVQSTIDELEARKIQISANISVKSDMTSEIAGVLNNGSVNKYGRQITKGSNATNISEIKLPKYKQLPLVKKKDISDLEDYQNELYGISNAMRFMTGTMGDSEASWLNWGASLLQSIAQAIPAIRSLIPALAAKTAGEAASSAAQTPVVGWLAAAGAAASVLATFASFPKFANGGIVHGRTLAEVGEYAGASSNPEVIAPLNKLKEYINPTNAGVENISFSLDYKIKGADIYASLNNYLRKTGKKL